MGLRQSYLTDVEFFVISTELITIISLFSLRVIWIAYYLLHTRLNQLNQQLGN